ncbi:synaptic vesicle glycoprotein 2C-like [Agrilus planipennis]|uniref:Synaptic vesicle glycoprotein 2C-like n=1 Tax=Agrilus planipennis TaxID=224129 RepID=A0A1W4WFM4_AGRPL|nr:synaptic vesicle glycoprotein 2C-like [Agrilus planipennis]
MVECTENSNCNSTQKKKSADVDSSLRMAGYGSFHYEFLVICACCILSAGFQNGLSAYLLPAAQCELGLNYADIGFTNAAFLVGGTSSALFWGIIADVTGRKRVLFITLMLDFFANVACCFVQNVVELSLCRFLSGFIIGAPASLIFTFMAEFHAPENRAKVICFSGVFFTVSWLILPIIAWLVLSFPFNFRLSSTLTITSWRFLIFVISLSDLISAVWLLRLPESPDFLVTKGKTKKALEIIKKIYSRNTGEKKENFAIGDIRVPIRVDSDDPKEHKQGKVIRIFKCIYSQIKIVFEKPLIVNSVLMSTIMFGNMYG